MKKDDILALAPNSDLDAEVVVMAHQVLDIPEFSLWPGSIKKHHPYTGGLLDHTYEVISLCMYNADFLEGFGNRAICRKSLFLAALYHDVGKIWDYAPVDGESVESISSCSHKLVDWDYTIHKRRIHHLSRSALYWEKSVEKMKMCEEIKDDVLHAILSHHGMKEWGSPVTPDTQMAWILHLCDSMSARCNDCVN